MHDSRRLAFPVLEPLEIHSGMVFGPRRTPLPPERVIPQEPGEIRDVLEEIILAGVSRTPCLVAFSGGRDSSALLALATHVARREGLADPIPLTYRFEEHERSDETQWQELVFRHLGLKDWEFVHWGAPLWDSLGEVARRTLLRHGLYWPPNIHTLVMLLEPARGGCLITGKGGDEVFSPVLSTPRFEWDVARNLPLARAINYSIGSLLPTPLGLRFKYRKRLNLSWLQGGARREIRRRFFATFAEELEGHPVHHFNETRYLELFTEITAVFADDAGATLLNPFIHPRFLGAWSSRTPPGGERATRAANMEALFGDLLPKAVVRRSTKAMFTEVFWGAGCRKFASEWDGTGLDSSLVDVGALRKEWEKSPPDLRAYLPLQAAWLSVQPNRPARGQSVNPPKFIPVPD